jgi:hypothetical protein
MISYPQFIKQYTGTCSLHIMYLQVIMWEIEEKILGVEKMITNESSPPWNFPIRCTCMQSYMQGACPCIGCSCCLLLFSFQCSVFMNCAWPCYFYFLHFFCHFILIYYFWSRRGTIWIYFIYKYNLCRHTS